jgi:hypothetical protein
MAGKKAAPFVYLGQLTYKEHSGAKPMNVVWNMAEPLSPFIAKEFLQNSNSY